MNESDVIETKEELKADKPKMVPINFTMISGDNNTPPEDIVSYAQVAYVDSEWFHNNFLPRYYKLMDDVYRHVDEVNNGK